MAYKPVLQTGCALAIHSGVVFRELLRRFTAPILPSQVPLLYSAQAIPSKKLSRGIVNRRTVPARLDVNLSRCAAPSHLAASRTDITSRVPSCRNKLHGSRQTAPALRTGVQYRSAVKPNRCYEPGCCAGGSLCTSAVLSTSPISRQGVNLSASRTVGSISSRSRVLSSGMQTSVMPAL